MIWHQGTEARLAASIWSECVSPQDSYVKIPMPTVRYYEMGSLRLAYVMSFSCGSAGKESACNAGDSGSTLGLGRSAGEGKGYPLQYSWTSLVVQRVKNLPAMQETCV